MSEWLNIAKFQKKTTMKRIDKKKGWMTVSAAEPCVI